MIIAIDGPAAAGKGTLARLLAAQYGLEYLDTGSLYRAVALRVLENGDDPNDSNAAAIAAQRLNLAGIEEKELRTVLIGEAASIVSSIPEVREALIDFQRGFAKGRKGAVLDGRDIGTVVAPDADVKLYVTASAEVRAARRADELRAAGESVENEEILATLKARDGRDAARATAPLQMAEDALLLDTTKLDIEAAFQAALALVGGAIGGGVS